MLSFEDVVVGNFADWDRWPERRFIVEITDINPAIKMVRVCTVISKTKYGKPLYDEWVFPSTLSRQFDPNEVTRRAGN